MNGGFGMEIESDAKLLAGVILINEIIVAPVSVPAVGQTAKRDLPAPWDGPSLCAKKGGLHATDIPQDRPG